MVLDVVDQTIASGIIIPETSSPKLAYNLAATTIGIMWIAHKYMGDALVLISCWLARELGGMWYQTWEASY